MQTSAFRTVALGKVDSNREPGIYTKANPGTITVIPVEWTAMHDGEMTSNPVKVEYSATDQDGVTSQGGFIADQIIECDWLPSGSNRLSPPDVRRGERVEILQVADADKFYWRSLGMDDNLRKLETVIFAISATRDENDTLLTADNTYWIEFSTHSKRLAFSSCKADGEPYQYEMFLDMAEGLFQLNDDVGNFITLVSKLSLIHLQNTQGTFVKLDKKDINAYAPQDFTFKADRDVNITCGRNFTVKAANQAQIDGGGSVMTWTGAMTALKTPNFVGTT